MVTQVIPLLLVSLVARVAADYDCACNYAVEAGVYSSPDKSSAVLGYMYEFDCKPLAALQSSTDFLAIQFEKKLAYLYKDNSGNLKAQLCPGSPPLDDLVPTTTIPTTSADTTLLPATTTPDLLTPLVASIALTTESSTVPSTPVPTTSPPSTVTTTTSDLLTTPVTSSALTTESSTAPSTSTSTTVTTTTAALPTSPFTSTTTSHSSPNTSLSSTESTTVPTSSTTQSTTLPSTLITVPSTVPVIFTSTMGVASSTASIKPDSANVTGTIFEYIGLGYNLVYANPLVNPDPGFSTHHRIFKLTGNFSSVNEATHQSFSPCVQDNTNVFVTNFHSYLDELKTLVKISSSHGNNLTAAAFTGNTDVANQRLLLDSAGRVVLDSITTCKRESAQYINRQAGQSNFTITREFARDVCSLPVELNQMSWMEYQRFLDKWGTSVVTEVEFGTETISRRNLSISQVLELFRKTNPDLIKHTGPYQGYYSSLSVNLSDYTYHGASPLSTDVQTFTIGSLANPAPISISVVPIAAAMDPAYWRPILDDLTAEGICPDSIYGSGIQAYQTNIQAALQNYISHVPFTAGSPSQAPVSGNVIQVPLTWPAGTYGLMEAAGGCPRDRVTWLTGWRYQDTEDVGSHNFYSPSIGSYIRGEYHENNVKTYFCIKSRHSSTEYDRAWEHGAYCLLKYGTCPAGFAEGYIFWDDEDLNNHNDKGGTLPDGQYDKNTKIYYCCRSDGSPNEPIYLPTDRPFVLVRYGNTCQSVHGMNVFNLFIDWDDEDLRNKDTSGGMHPLDDGGSKNHKLHFCYYEAHSDPSIIG